MPRKETPTLDWCAANLVFTRDQSRRVDALATEEYGVPGVALMENAAIGLCRVALRMLGERGGGVAILCGPGANGGDGFALARHLANRGVETHLAALAAIERYSGDAETNATIAQRMGLAIRPLHHLEGDEMDDALDELCAGCALVVDALLGTGLTNPAREPIAGVIRWLNAQRAARAPWRVLAVDVPSGLDCDSGAPLGDADSAVRAGVTATMAGMKAGFLRPGAREYTGDVEVVDIGAPVAALVRAGTRRG